MSKHTRWLATESERWVAERIVSTEQAAQIRALYVEPAGALSWGLIVFFGLGAVVIGCGVILLFAYNWDEIPKYAKLALVFGGIVAAHVRGVLLRTRGGWQARLADALSLLGTMGFGAGIWLVAQIYHIDEHFPNGFLIWAVGALAMAWVLESTSHGVLAAGLFSIWGGTEIFAFNSPADTAAICVAAGIGPLVWRVRSAVLLAVVLAALYWLLLCSAGRWDGVAAVFGNLFALSVLLLGTAKFVEEVGLDERARRVVSFFGWMGFLVGAFALSFKGTAHSILLRPPPEEFAPTLIYRWLGFALAVATWCYVAWRWRRSREFVAREEWLCPIALIYAQGLLFLGRGDDVFVATVFNLICVGIAVAWMVRGCREGVLRTTVLGSLLLAAVLFARYFDLFESLALRGLAFLVFGGVLFAEGFYYRRLRRAEAEAVP